MGSQGVGTAPLASSEAVRLVNRRAGFEACRPKAFATGGSRLSAIRAGEGPPIIMLHGFPSFWACWLRQIDALSSRFGLCMFDAPGAGASPRAGDLAQFRIEALAEEVMSAIRQTAPAERAVLVGHDWGAALGFALAQRHPDAFAGVIGIAAPPFALVLELLERDDRQRALSHYMAGLCTLGARDAERLAPTLAREAYRGLAERDAISADEFELFARACGDPAAYLAGAAWYAANIPPPLGHAPRVGAWPPGNPSLAIPALLIWGEDDRTFVRDAPALFKAQHPGAEVLKIPAAGHWTMLEAPDIVNRAIGDFAGRSFAREATAAGSAAR